MAKMSDDRDDDFEDDAPRRRGRRGDEDDSRDAEDIALAKSKVNIPTLLLLLTGTLVFLLSLGSTIVGVVAPDVIINQSFDFSKSMLNSLPPGPQKDAELEKLEVAKKKALAQGVNFVSLAFTLVGHALQLFMLFGLIQMRKLKMWGASLAACILSIVFAGVCCCFPIIFSILGIVALVNPEVKRGFELTARARG
ncbi:MAG: hypothetical protein ACRC8S_12715 [Fimbriiglobus sp.]